MSRKAFWVYVHCNHDLRDLTISHLGHWQQSCKYYQLIIKIEHGSKKLWPGHRIWLCVHLDLGDMMLTQGHDTSLDHKHHLCEKLSRSNMAVRNYGPETDFGYVCTVTLAIMTLVQGHDTPLEQDHNCVKFYPDPTWQWGVMVLKRILCMCALWPWLWRYDLSSRSWYTLGPKAIIVLNIQIQHCSEKLWSGNGFGVCVLADLDIGDMTLVQGHNIPLGHWHQLCKISRLDKGVRSYDQDKMWTDRQGDSYITQTLRDG